MITSYPYTFTTPANAAFARVVQHGVPAPTGIQLEKGNIPTAFNESPIDTNQKINNAQADAITAKARTEGLSGFDGGLGFANLFKLMPLGSTTESAGLNGQPKDNQNKPLPAFYTGTFVDAVSNVSNFIVRHDGTIKSGAFDFNIDGSAVIKDTAGFIRMIMSRNNISALLDLFGSSTSGSVNNQAYSTNNTGITDILLSNVVTVLNNNTRVSILVTLHTEVHANSYQADGESNVALYIESESESVLLGTCIAECTNGVTGFKYVNIDKSIILSKGIYKLRLHVNNINYKDTSFTSDISSSVTSYSYSATAQRSEFGRNGLVTIADINNFMYAAVEADGFKFMLRGTGNKIDIPGILATGSVSSGAADSNKWGAKSSGNISVKLGTGQYRVYHSVGKLGYTVGLTSTTDSVDARCVGKGDNYIDVNCRNSNNVLVDASFDYELKGDNQ